MRLAITKVLSSRYLGDFAIARGMLESIALKRPDWALDIFCRDPLRDGPGLSQYGSVFPELFSEPGVKLSYPRVAFRMLRYFLWYSTGLPCLDMPGREFVKKLAEADLVVFCGGGSPGGYGLHNLVLFAVVPMMFASRLKIPVIFTGLGLEPTSSAATLWLTRWVLRRATLVTARDPGAAHRIRKLARITETRLTADWAFLLTPLTAASQQTTLVDKGSDSTLRIGINLRDQQSPGPEGVLGENAMSRDKLLGLIYALLEGTNTQIIVASMNRSQRTDDFAYACALCSELPEALQNRVQLLPPDCSLDEIRGAIEGVDVFIGTRLHPTIFALSASIPTLALHSSAKVRDLIAYFNLPEFHFSLEDTDKEQMISSIEYLRAHGLDIKNRIDEKLPVIRAAAAENLAVIEACIKATESPAG
jgi:polysaccharide pyruvyl transferase WcaK-like protein